MIMLEYDGQELRPSEIPNYVIKVSQTNSIDVPAFFSFIPHSTRLTIDTPTPTLSNRSVSSLTVSYTLIYLLGSISDHVRPSAALG